MSEHAAPVAPEGSRRVEQALRAADRGEAYHWPTIAAVLAAEVRRLRASPDPEKGQPR